VSHHQGCVDWAAAAGAGVNFCWIKATEGWSGEDREFERNAAGSAEHGIERGPYHFWRFDVADYQRQALHFIEHINRFAWDLPPALDLEDERGPVGASQVKWAIEAIREQTGWTPVIYSGGWWLSKHNFNPDWLKEHWLWLANYPQGYDQVPKGMDLPWQVAHPSFVDGDSVLVWQYTSCGDGRAHGTHSRGLDRNRTPDGMMLDELVRKIGSPR